MAIAKAVLNYLFELTSDWGLAIILLTVGIRLALLPLNIKSMKFARVSKEITPRIEDIKKKYKGDQNKINEATVELWKEYNVNPAAGCLPLFIQMPILIAVIRALHEIFTETQSALFLGIKGFNLALPGAGEWAFTYGPQYVILPILAAVTTYINQKQMSAGQTQGNMKMMNYMFTLMFVWITLRYPAGVALYWVVGSLFAIGQYYVFNKLQDKVAHNEEAGASGKRNKERQDS